MWTMSSSLGMLVAFGLSVGYPLQAERRDLTSSKQLVATIVDSNHALRDESPVCATTLIVTSTCSVL